MEKKTTPTQYTLLEHKKKHLVVVLIVIIVILMTLFRMKLRRLLKLASAANPGQVRGRRGQDVWSPVAMEKSGLTALTLQLWQRDQNPINHLL